MFAHLGLWHGPFLLALMTGLPDAHYLKQQADSIGVPSVVAWAIAWEETRRNTDPRVRGGHGEVGRFQLLPATARWACPHMNVREYAPNVRCGLTHLRSLHQRYGSWPEAIRAYNGRGPRARAYRVRVLASVGLFVLTVPADLR